MSEKNYTEMLESVFGAKEDYFLEKGKSDIFYLSRWILPRLLLGKNIEAAREFVMSQIDSFETSKKTAAAANDLAMLAVLSEIFDIPAGRIIEQAFNQLVFRGDFDENRHADIQTALAFSFFTNDERETLKWRNRAMKLPFETGAEYVNFELLYLISFQNVENADSDHLANITAKIIYKVLTGAPFLSSGPHILVLTALFKNRKNLSELLKGRIKHLDRIILNNDAELKVKFSKLKLESLVKEDFPFLRFSTIVRGEGEIKAGCSDDGAVTYNFAPYLNRYAEKDEDFETVIKFSGTKIAAEIFLNKYVSISETEFKFLEKRFAVAVEIAKNHLGEMTSNFELELKN